MRIYNRNEMSQFSVLSCFLYVRTISESCLARLALVTLFMIMVMENATLETPTLRTCTFTLVLPSWAFPASIYLAATLSLSLSRFGH